MSTTLASGSANGRNARRSERAWGASVARIGNTPPKPASVVQAWVSAVESDDWSHVFTLYAARREPPPREVPEPMKAKLKATARKLDRALRGAPPVFAAIEAVLAEPAHLEWYYCGERPQGKVWRSPCAVSVVGSAGSWTILDITDDAPSD